MALINRAHQINFSRQKITS